MTEETTWLESPALISDTGREIVTFFFSYLIYVLHCKPESKASLPIDCI